ncbi:MAG TPA: hypothetical protein VEB86_00590, partial [Chryseosolibacter sp.]|nr:hypothetical protein [Chryseosolibacter sp.]
MKRIKPLFLIALALTLSLSSHSKETPEEIQVRTRIIQSHDWYKTQFELWKTELESDPSAGAWLNHYAAARFSHMDKSVLSLIEKGVANSFPNTLQSFLIASWNRGFTSEAFQLLLKARELDPKNVFVNSLLALHHEYNLDAEQRATVVNELWMSNGMSVSLMNYCYNVLMSVEDGAVLFTEGENMTLPMFLLQDLFRIRTDVQVINLDLLLETDYRERKLKQTGL